MKFFQYRSVKITLQLLLVVAVYLGISLWKVRDAAHGEAPMINDVFMDGQPALLSDYRGKPVMVHFWATWCPVCKLENSNVAAIAKRYPVITIASWSESAAEVKDFMQQHQLHMPVIVDNDGEWAKLYGVKGVPTSFFIDADGRVRLVESGYTTWLGMALRLEWLGG